MKRRIRVGTFESNSSSMHSVSVSKTGDINRAGLSVDIDNNEEIIIPFGEFGWGYEEYTDAYHKLQYLLTMVAETEDYKNIDEYYQTSGFQKILDAVEEVTLCNSISIRNHGIKYNKKYGYVEHDGYIDHQSLDTLDAFLNDYNCTAEEFIFDPGITLIIDNDNH